MPLRVSYHDSLEKWTHISEDSSSEFHSLKKGKAFGNDASKDSVLGTTPSPSQKKKPKNNTPIIKSGTSFLILNKKKKEKTKN